MKYFRLLSMLLLVFSKPNLVCKFCENGKLSQKMLPAVTMKGWYSVVKGTKHFVVKFKKVAKYLGECASATDRNKTVCGIIAHEDHQFFHIFVATLEDGFIHLYEKAGIEIYLQKYFLQLSK